MNNNVATLNWLTPYCGLPGLDLRYEDDLKRLNINYVIRDNYCVIFDPNVVGSRISLTGRMEASFEMGCAAERYYAQKEVYTKVVLPFDRKEFDELFSSTSEDGISLYWSEDDFGISAKGMDSKYFLFKLDTHRDLMGEGYFRGLVILKSKVKPNQVLQLKVPSMVMGMAIGKKGANAKELAKQLGVRRVVFNEI